MTLEEYETLKVGDRVVFTGALAGGPPERLYGTVHQHLPYEEGWTVMLDGKHPDARDCGGRLPYGYGLFIWLQLRGHWHVFPTNLTLKQELQALWRPLL